MILIDSVSALCTYTVRTQEYHVKYAHKHIGKSKIYNESTFDVNEMLRYMSGVGIIKIYKITKHISGDISYNGCFNINGMLCRKNEQYPPSIHFNDIHLPIIETKRIQLQQTIIHNTRAGEYDTPDAHDIPNISNISNMSHRSIFGTLVPNNTPYISLNTSPYTSRNNLPPYNLHNIHQNNTPVQSRYELPRTLLFNDSLPRLNTPITPSASIPIITEQEKLYSVKCPICREINDIYENTIKIIGCSDMCCICSTQNAEIVFTKCSHVNTCSICLNGIKLNNNNDEYSSDDEYGEIEAY